MRDLIKSILTTVLILILISMFFGGIFEIEKEKKTNISQLAKDIQEGKVEKILISEDNLTIFYKDKSKAFAQKETESSLTQTLINLGVEKEKLRDVVIEKEEASKILRGLGMFLLYIISPILVFFLLFYFFFRQTKGGITQTFDFTKARARVFIQGMTKEKITFKDVGGLKEAKEELKEIVDFLKNPKKYERMGARVPKGVLLVGPSGTGKTLLAKAVAGEAGVPFIYASGSSFVELFVGVGAGRIRDLFNLAKRHQPSIIFIDELDAIGKMRGPAIITGGHEEREQTLNQLLTEMDGFEPNTEIIVLAATNRPDVLDPALLRPGRFDRRIVLDLPDISEREEILKLHCQKKPLASNVNLREIAERTPGFSGADLANVANEAAILAARKGKDRIYQEEFYEAIEKVLLGPERKSHILTKREKEIAAYHEAGHALVSVFVGGEPVRKISIVARSFVGGYTLRTPKEERKIRTKSEFLAEISTLLGGYCAEKLKFKEISTGAANDLELASSLARKLVKEYGMSSLGPVSFGKREEALFGESEFIEYKIYSEKTATILDKEVLKLIKECEKKATGILKKKKALLNLLAQRLLEKETIEKEEFEKIIQTGARSSAGRARLL